MKVLIVTNMYPNPVRAYSGRFIQDHVRSLERSGLEVEVSFTNPKLSRSQYVVALPSLRRALAKGFDVIHAQHTYSMFQLQAVTPLVRKRPPVVLTCHEGEAGIPSRYRDPKADPIKRLVYSARLKRRAARMADEVVAVSEQVRDHLQLGTCQVIPAAVDMDLFRPIDSISARHAIGVEDEGSIALFPADPHRFGKGFDLLQRALSELQNPVRLIVGGDIPPESMPLYMNAADVVVQTSRYEASPMVVKEAMACCKPIVTTDVGDVRWLLDNEPGHHIVRFDPSAIAGAISEALNFGGPTTGRTRLEKLGLTLEQTTHRYLEVYEHAFQNHAVI
jgi:glycosyltransferase involved in cell wall biosynthesis